MAQFTQEQINIALAEFTANPQSRTVAAAGYNGDVTIYGAQNDTIQKTSGKCTGAEESGPDGG